MIHAGHPRDQAIAAALNIARKKAAEGGMRLGVDNPQPDKIHVGPIHSAVAGRTWLLCDPGRHHFGHGRRQFHGWL